MNSFKTFFRSQAGGLSAGSVVLGIAIIIGFISFTNGGGPTMEERYQAELQKLHAN